MPEGSRVGGFPVMEPAEQSTTGRQTGQWVGGWVGGSYRGQGCGMRKRG